MNIWYILPISGEKTFLICEIYGEIFVFVLGRFVESNSQERSCTLKFLPGLNHYFGTICEFACEADLLIRPTDSAAPDFFDAVSVLIFALALTDSSVLKDFFYEDVFS